MSYIGNPITTQAFVTDQFNGSGSQVTYTMSVAPANTSSVLVSVSGVLQDPSTYSVSGNTLTFSAAPPAGTGNISCRYLGIPATGVTTTAYRTITEFTAGAGQTTFTPPSYTVGFIDVYRNGIRLGSADYTANSGTVVTLSVACNAGDLVVTESYYVSSVLNAIPATPGAVNSTYLGSGLTASINTLNQTTGLFSTNNAYLGIAKAWANFNPSSGTVVINNSFNISSITRNGAGDFTVNFTTAMPNANYVLSGQTQQTNTYFSNSIYFVAPSASTPSTTSFRFLCFGWSSGTAGVQYDAALVSFVIHGN